MAFFHAQPSAIEAQFNYGHSTKWSQNFVSATSPNLLKLTVTKTSPTATTVAVASWQKIKNCNRLAGAHIKDPYFLLIHVRIGILENN